MGGEGRSSVSQRISDERLAKTTRVRRRLAAFLRYAARPVLWGSASVIDFLIEDTCVLCGRPSRPAGSPHVRRRGPVGHLLEPVKQPLLAGWVYVINHPVCGRCAAGFDRARDAGLLGWLTAAAEVETRHGDRFAMGGGPGAPSRLGPDAPVPIRVVSPFMTNDNVLQIIHLLKFGGYRALADPVGCAIGAAVGGLGPGGAACGDDPAVTFVAGGTGGTDRPDGAGDTGSADGTGGWVVVPVPMERRDIRRRGFNQARDIAARVAAYLGVPGRFEAVRKTARTTPQSRTHRADRAGNVRGVFTASPQGVDGRHVLLVDDLVTTGATAASCAAALYAAGARRVTVLCFGRAL